uniref:Transmembrane protein n=1 Tax=Cucumis melo TaxID=3656 RepID=A0A9I9EAZ9_CUCME
MHFVSNLEDIFARDWVEIYHEMHVSPVLPVGRDMPRDGRLLSRLLHVFLPFSTFFYFLHTPIWFSGVGTSAFRCATFPTSSYRLPCFALFTSLRSTLRYVLHSTCTIVV